MLLRNKTILLAAAPPLPPLAGDAWELASNVEEATLSLARAIVAEGGRIAMAWNDALSPLVAQVAIEQQRPRLAEQNIREDPREREPRFVAFRLAGTSAGVWERALAGVGAGQVHEVARDPSDRPGRRRDRSPARASLRALRETMIRESAPVALVGVGGGDELDEVIDLFAERLPRTPIYVLSTTRAGELHRRRSVHFIDREILDRHEGVFAELASPYGWERPEDDDVARVVPYPLVAQVLVEQLGHVQREGEPPIRR